MTGSVGKFTEYGSNRGCQESESPSCWVGSGVIGSGDSMAVGGAVKGADGRYFSHCAFQSAIVVNPGRAAAGRYQTHQAKVAPLSVRASRAVNRR